MRLGEPLLRAAYRMAGEARQGLVAHHFTRRQVDDRLEHDVELFRSASRSGSGRACGLARRGHGSCLAPGPAAHGSGRGRQHRRRSSPRSRRRGAPPRASPRAHRAPRSHSPRRGASRSRHSGRPTPECAIRACPRTRRGSRRGRPPLRRGGLRPRVPRRAASARQLGRLGCARGHTHKLEFAERIKRGGRSSRHQILIVRHENADWHPCHGHNLTPGETEVNTQPFRRAESQSSRLCAG